MSEFKAVMDRIRAERLEERRRERVAKRRRDFMEELKEKQEQEGRTYLLRLCLSAFVLIHSPSSLLL